MEGFLAHVKSKDGTNFYIETNSRLVKDKKGNPNEIRGIFRNVTHKIQLAQKLKHSESKYHALFENSLDAIMLLDKDGKIIEYNRKALQTIGVRLKTNKPILCDIFYKKDCESLIQTTIKKDVCHIPVLPFEKENGQIKYVAISASKIVYNSSFLIQIILHDVATRLTVTSPRSIKSSSKVQKQEV